MLVQEEESYEELTINQGRKAVESCRERLPQNADLALLCFTGSRAFGWGSEHYDIDCKGYFVRKEKWFGKVLFSEHTDIGGYDVNLRNMQSFEEPQMNFDAWNTYVDTTNPIFIHKDFDFNDFRNHLEPNTISSCYPFNIGNQLQRLEMGWSPRTALHSYKEVMFPLNYLWYGDMEINVMKINRKERFQLEGLPPCRNTYYEDAPFNEDYKEVVNKEVWDLFDKIGEELSDRGIDY